MASYSIDLTDAELRRELKELGENPGPITANTRSIYKKRLLQLKTSKVSSNDTSSLITGSKNKDSKIYLQKSLAGFSSDESDKEVTKNRRKTVPSRNQRKSTRKLRVDDQSRKISENSSQPTSLSTPKITNGYSDDSDDADDSKGSWVQVSTAVTNTSPGLFSNTADSFVSKRRSLRTGSCSSPFANLFRPAEATTPKSSRDADVNSDSQVASLHSPNQHLDSDPQQSPSTARKDTKNGGDVIRRRALTQAKKQNNLNPSESPKAEPNNIVTAVKPNSSQNPSSAPWKFSFLRRPKLFSTDSSHPLWPLHCSVLIPVCIIGFFIMLGLLYVTMRSDEVFNRPPFLPPSTAETEKVKEMSTMNVVNFIYETLATTVGNNICEESNAPNILSVSHLKSRLKADEQTFASALNLIRKHSEWNILLYKDQASTALSPDESVAAVRYLETTTAILPTLCRLQRAVYKVFYRLGLALLAGLAIWLTIIYRNYCTRKAAAERQEIFLIVEKILDVLRKNYESSLDDDSVEPFIPIVHVRDMVIPSRDRQRKLKTWEKAVRFISASESRIRVETQRVSGEDFRVWRWIQVTTPAKRNQAPKRVWQGTAIVTNRSINTPNISPTPCLKIRHMFDPDAEQTNDWEIQVQDSILEKCSDGCDILSVVIEKQSKEGLVYVKCSSCAGAGRAFRSLHGVWFDGRLVTVKFITLQRFHYRYPNTANQMTPLEKSLPYSVSTFAPQEDLPGGFSTSTPIKRDD